MDAKINYQLQDCGALLKAIDNNRAVLDENGLSEETYTGLVNARGALAEKEVAQSEAVNLFSEKTNEQDEVIASVKELLKRVRAAAYSAYGRDKDKLEPFNLNQDISSSVKKLRSMSEYLSSAVEAHKDELLKNGLLQEDLDNLSSSHIYSPPLFIALFWVAIRPIPVIPSTVAIFVVVSPRIAPSIISAAPARQTKIPEPNSIFLYFFVFLDLHLIISNILLYLPNIKLCISNY